MVEHNLHNAVHINELEAERDRLVEQLKGMDKIRTRITQLETIIKTWKDVIEEEQPPIPQGKLSLNLSDEISLSDTSSIEMTHVEGIVIILKESGRLLSINEIQGEFRKRNWKISEANANIIIGRILRKRNDLFIAQKGEKGLTMFYGLKNC